MLWPFQNPNRFFEKIFSENLDICLRMLLSYNFDKKPVKYLQVYSYLSNRFFLSSPNVCYFLRHVGDKKDFIKLLILTYRKSLNISELLLIILMRISEWWEAAMLFKSWISFSSSMK